MHCTLGTKLEDRAALLRDLGRLEKQVNKSIVRFSKGPAPGQTEVITEGDKLRASSMEKPPRVKMSRISSMPLQQRRQTMPWVVSEKGEPAGNGRDPIPSLCTCLFSLEKERLKGELIATCSFLKKRNGAGLCPEIFRSYTGMGRLKLEYSKLLLGSRKAQRASIGF